MGEWKTKGITYHVLNDKTIIDHIQKQPNQSRYVLDLVEGDMNKESEAKKKKKIVDQILKERGD